MADSRFHSNSGPKTLKEIASLIDASLIGNGDKIIQDVAPLNVCKSHDISFLDNIKYKDDFKNTKAGACIISEKMKEFRDNRRGRR